MKINESNFVEELSHRNEKALEYVMVHYGGLVKSVTHRYLNVLSQYEEECINDVFFAVWEHIDSYDSARNPFANWIGGIARLKALDYKRKYAHFLLETSCKIHRIQRVLTMLLNYRRSLMRNFLKKLNKCYPV